MTRILVTAFEPFGLIGSWIRRSNASLDVMESLKIPDLELNKLTLPVSDAGVEAFIETLNKTKPDGIISLGEHMLISDVVLEPYARNVPVSSLPLRAIFGEKVQSAFVRAWDTGSSKSRIGGYYCNQIYLHGLKWAQENGQIPVAFVHIPVIGDGDKYRQQVENVLGKMKSVLHHTPFPS